MTKNVPCARRCTVPDNDFQERQEGDWTVFEKDAKPDEEDERNNMSGKRIRDKSEIPDEYFEDEQSNQDDQYDRDKGSNKSNSFFNIPQSQWTIRPSKEQCPFSVTNVIDNHHIIEEEYRECDINDRNNRMGKNNRNDKNIQDDTDDNSDDFYDANEDALVVDYEENENILRTRSYDVYITWDKHYRTPRVWLFGYDEHRNPLTHKQIFEDVSPEHAHKTVTYEYHPHENYMALSIHPCKHASVMKKLIANWNEREGKGKVDGIKLRVDQYLFLFLKFIGTVIPTVEYDYSLNM